MSEQELTEAVRIVREIVRPLAWARERWSGHGWVRDTKPADALDAVLAALHQARDVAGGAQQRVLDLEAERDAAQRDLAHQEDLTDRQRGRAEEYGRTCQERERWDILLKQAEAERDALRAEVGRLKTLTVSLANDVGYEYKERAEQVEEALREILHAEQWADVVSIIDAALRDTTPSDYERFKASSPENAALLDAEERVLAAEQRAAEAEAALRAARESLTCGETPHGDLKTVDIIDAALRDTAPRYAPGMNASDHKPHCDILTTRDGWDADCTCALPAPSQPCDSCDPSFGCFDGGEPCRKVPLCDTAHIFDADRSYVEGMNGYPCATCGEYESNPKHHAPSEERDFSWFRGSVDKELVKKLMDMRARARGSSEARWKSERINRHAGRDTAPAEEGKP